MARYFYCVSEFSNFRRMEYDYYKILGINQWASDLEVKKAFRIKAKRFHPDKNREENAHAFFQVLNDAYQTLSDPVKRLHYDQKLNGGHQQSSPIPNSREERRAERRKKNEAFSRAVHQQPITWVPPVWVQYFFYLVGTLFGVTVCYFSLYNIVSGIWNPVMLWVTLLGLIVLMDSVGGLIFGQAVLSQRFFHLLKKTFIPRF